MLQAQRARVDVIQRKTGRVVPWIFCLPDGAPVGDFKRAWATACIRAGFFRVVGTDAKGRPIKMPTMLFHDFRRTSARNLIRAGISETVAMKLTGHRTRSVFQRYAIVEEGMLQEAGARLIQGAKSKVTRSRGKVVDLARRNLAGFRDRGSSLRMTALRTGLRRFGAALHHICRGFCVGPSRLRRPPPT